MVKCPNCGKETTDNFCGNCGTKIEKQNICPNCENELVEDDVFCPKCGEKINENDENPSEKETDDVGSEDDLEEETADEDSSQKDSEDKTQKEDTAYCPYCNCEIEEYDEFCQECGKPINIGQESFESVKLTIQPKKIIIFSILSIIISLFISLILSYIFFITGIGLYPIAFFISLIIVVGIFASFKDYLNGGLVGIISGLFIGLVATTIVEYVNGFSFSYDMFSGYAPIIFTIFGAIIGIISSKFLRNSVKKFVDVENLF